MKSPSPSTSVKRELHFVTVNGPKSQSNADQKARSSVRAFVMRDYLRQKNNPSWKFAPATVSNRMDSHISRFRSSRPSSAVRVKKRKSTGRRERGVRQRPKQQRLLIPAPSDLYFHLDQTKTDSQLHDLDSIDAFNILTVDLSNSETQSLLQYYQTTFWANSYACNPEGRWISVALMDPAIIHATLSLVAIHRRDLFSVDLSNVYFKHRGEAMKIVRSRLDDPEESLSDATIGAVSILSSSDNHYEWPANTQTIHSQGLARLIDMRGGLESLSSNRHIQRVAGWADLLHSATHGTKPRIEMPERLSTLSRNEYDSAPPGLEPRNAPMAIVLQDLPANIADSLRELRILSSLKASLISDRSEELCRTFSDLLWKLEYSILDLDEPSTTEASPVLAARPSRSPLTPHVIGIASLLFSYSALRDLAAPVLFDKLSGRLRTYLSAMSLFSQSGLPLEDEEFQKFSFAASVDGNETSLFLWILYLGWQGSRKDVDIQQWFMRQIAQICWQSEILSYEAATAQIHSVVPQAQELMIISEDFWARVEDALWTEVISDL